MPTFVKGNLWDQCGNVDLLLFTGNSVLDGHNHLVMGKGSAAEMKRLYPDTPRQFGVTLLCEGYVGKTYGILTEWAVRLDTSGYHQWQRVGAFQTKRHWRDPSDLLLIAHSVGVLCGILHSETPKYYSVAMPFPGIGAGGLARPQVLSLLWPLPDLVQIYEPAL